jgi:hypothetical protein
MHVKLHYSQEEIKEDKEKDGSPEAPILMGIPPILQKLKSYS